MKYKNNTLNTITYDSQYSSREITLSPGEEIDINFYIDPSRTEFTLVDDNNCVDPLILVESYSLSATPTIVQIPKPKLSAHYKISITSDNEYSLGFNKDSFNKINVGTDIYFNTVIWEYAPILILTSNASANVNVLIEEAYSI